jgi:hypothetical protein
MKLSLARINPESLKELEAMIGPDQEPTHFFTMTEINKIGINPQSKYNTPLGIYAYPLTETYYKYLTTGKLPFAGNKPYINIFNLKDDLFNLASYTKSDLTQDLKKLEALPEPPNQNLIDEAFGTSKEKTPISKFWNLTRLMAGSSKNWNVLLRSLGYTNFYDPGQSVIHSAEPDQIVILDPRIISPVKTYLNPFVLGTELGKADPVDKQTLYQKYKQKLDATNMLDKVMDIKGPKTLLKVTKYFLEKGDYVGIYAVIKNKSKTPEIISFIVNGILSRPANGDGIDIVDQLVSKNELSKEDYVNIIKSDKPYYINSVAIMSEDQDILLMVANSNNVFQSTLYKLIKKFNDSYFKASPEVRKAAFNNWVKKESIGSIIETIESYHGDPTFIKLCLEHPNPEVREAAKNSRYVKENPQEFNIKDIEVAANSKYHLLINSISIFNSLI